MLFDGLSPIVCGVLGYVSIILYDLNNTSHNNDRMQSLYTVGAGANFDHIQNYIVMPVFAYITGWTCVETDFSTNKDICEINQTINEYIISLINYSKKTNTDILGIKNKIYKHYPKKYNQYKNKNIYEISNININTKTKLFRYGNSNTSNYGGNNE